MFDDSIPIDEKIKLLHCEPAFEINALHIPIPEMYENYALKDVENSFISKEYENFHRIWRLDNVVPQRARMFFNEFPRVASNWDSDHHAYNSDYDFILRWFPIFAQNLSMATWLFPELKFEDKLKVFSASPVPNKFEKQLCNELKGTGLYNRRGKWSCFLVKGKVNLENDEFGPKFFVKFEEYIVWKRLMREKLKQAVVSGREDEAEKIRAAKKRV